MSVDKITDFNPGPAETRVCLAVANSVDPDQLASKEANWSGSAPFVIKGERNLKWYCALK